MTRKTIPFEGVELTPVSTITRFPRKSIVETMVKAYRTIQGETYYSCIGRDRHDGLWWPLAPDTRDFDTAWAVRERVEELLTDARRQREERDAVLAGRRSRRTV